MRSPLKDFSHLNFVALTHAPCSWSPTMSSILYRFFGKQLSFSLILDWRLTAANHHRLHCACAIRHEGPARLHFAAFGFKGSWVTGHDTGLTACNFCSRVAYLVAVGKYFEESNVLGKNKCLWFNCLLIFNNSNKHIKKTGKKKCLLCFLLKHLQASARVSPVVVICSYEEVELENPDGNERFFFSC